MQGSEDTNLRLCFNDDFLGGCEFSVSSNIQKVTVNRGLVTFQFQAVELQFLKDIQKVPVIRACEIAVLSHIYACSLGRVPQL